MLRDVDLSVGSESSLFCSDVVAFNAIFSFYTQREDERERERERDCTQPKKKEKKKEEAFIRARAGCFTQHFVEHCAILVCSSHSVNVGGVAREKRL